MGDGKGRGPGASSPTSLLSDLPVSRLHRSRLSSLIGMSANTVMLPVCLWQAGVCCVVRRLGEAREYG